MTRQGTAPPTPARLTRTRPPAKGGDDIFESFALGLARMCEPRDAPDRITRWEGPPNRLALNPSEIDMTKSNEMTFTPAALKQVLDAAIAEAVAAALGKAASVPKNIVPHHRPDHGNCR
jgi:hypothetical protein